MPLNSAAGEDSWRVPWTARSNQSILKEVSPEHSLEGLMMKLKLQYFCHVIQRINPLKKKLTCRKIEGKRRRGQQRMRWWDSITNLMDMNLSKFWEMVKVKEAWHTAVHGDEKSQTQLRDWKTTIIPDKHRWKNPQQNISQLNWRIQ